MEGLTVFGARGSASVEVAEAIAILYPKTELTAKQKKALEKAAKLAEKKKKQAEQVATLAAKKKGGASKVEKKKNEGAPKPQEDPYVSPKSGDKKVLRPMPNEYNRAEVEDSWYDWWVKEGFFKPEYGEKEGEKRETFTIVIPPPNVTGTLHLGHALTNAIEDAVVRWHRMSGKRVLWVPGCDHAGIATQTVVEKKLKREQNLSRHDLGRENFLKEVWKWKDSNGQRIYNQIKGLGASLDWDREAFTMCPMLTKAVEAAFIQLHDEKLIYRAERLINWSCTLQSAISDIEVDKIEIPGPTMMSVPGYTEKVQVGVLVKFAYKIQDSEQEIVVATTRIETMLGDTGVAVHPDDARYKDVVGKFCIHPFIPGRKIPIVADGVSADMTFGTGAVKITPAHDQNDYACGQRNGLEILTIFDKQGTISEGCGEFSGMKRFDARVAVIQKLKDLGLDRGTEANAMVIPVCSRSKDIIEPLLVPQWFCEASSWAADAVNLVETGELELLPKGVGHEKTWNNWLKNIKPWCISRQLWWGHRIPAYFATIDDTSIPAGADGDDKYWISASTEEEAKAKAAKRFNVDASKISLKRDEDVLDTWFSSGLYPMSTMGWPDKTPDMDKFYPGNLLETGYDILFFWVARMVMMCKHFTGKIPFNQVYLHSLVRDAHGRKMSKSLGNVVDPMAVRDGISLKDLQETLLGGNLDPKEVKKAQEGQAKDYPIGIPECGVDALRFGLCAFVSNTGKDVNLNVLRIKGYRQFCNKMWNLTKFAFMAFGESFTPRATTNLTGSESKADLWILSRLAEATKTANTGFVKYDFEQATTAIYRFWLYDLSQTYAEWIKPVLYADNADAKKVEASRNVLFTCLDSALRLIAPFMPYVSEELWQRLPQRPGVSIPSICVAPYPKSSELHNPELEAEISFIQSIIDKCRSMKTDFNMTSKVKPEVYFESDQKDKIDSIRALQVEIVALAKVQVLLPASTADIKDGCTQDFCDGAKIHLMVKGHVNVDEQLSKLDKSIASLEKLVAIDLTFYESAGSSKMDPTKLQERKAKTVTRQAELSTAQEMQQKYQQWK